MRYSYLLAAASGLLQVLIFPSFGYSLLAPVSLVPLLLAIARESGRRKQFLLGWIAGAIFWGGACYWIYDVMHRYAHLPALAAAAIFVGFFLVKGLHLGLFSVLAAPLLKTRWAIPVVAALWVALEGTHQYLGFTWLHLGNAGISMSVLARLAPYTGVYGVSFALALMNVALAAALLRKPRRQLAWLLLLPTLYLLPALPPPETGDKGVRLIQPNINPDEVVGRGWSRRRLAEHLSRMEFLSTEAAASSESISPELVIWPEYPLPGYFFADPSYRSYMERLARKTDAYLIFNAVDFEPAAERRPLNTAVTLDPAGEMVSRYDKIFLVPFGEFVPWPFSYFIEKVTLEAGDFVPGSEVALAEVGTHQVGTFICYEAVFARGVRRFVDSGAEVLVNISNDSWYGQSPARDQHLLIARMRAVENARWLLRATNDGITSIIDPAGRVVAALPSYEEGVLAGRFSYSSRTTWFTRFGEWFWWGSVLAAVGCWFIARRLA